MRAAIREFKEFAVRGNVVDLAVGIIIGAAFGQIVNSLVEDLLMPPIGLLVSRVDFSELAWVLSSPRVKPKQSPSATASSLARCWTSRSSSWHCFWSSSRSTA